VSADLYFALGAAADAMARSDEYCQYPIACLTLWIEPAICHEQIHFFRDDSGQVCGYMTWAWLAEDTERRLLHDSNVLLHISEWNEGERLWILDFLVHSGDVRSWIREARMLFGEATQAKSLHRREDGSVRKVITWKKRSSRGTSQRSK
jgi:cytolysin-activating lysine-acyltransferase